MKTFLCICRVVLRRFFFLHTKQQLYEYLKCPFAKQKRSAYIYFLFVSCVLVQLFYIQEEAREPRESLASFTSMLGMLPMTSSADLIDLWKRIVSFVGGYHPVHMFHSQPLLFHTLLSAILFSDKETHEKSYGFFSTFYYHIPIPYTTGKGVSSRTMLTAN